MRRKVCVRILGGIAAGSLWLFGAAPMTASAAVTIGQASPVIPAPCGNSFVATQLSVAPGGPAYSYSPTAHGVITSWSYRAGAGAGRTIQLTVVQSNPGANPTAHTTVQADQVRLLTLPNQINTFAGLRIPIAPTQKLGLHIPAGQPVDADPKSACSFKTLDPTDTDVMGTSPLSMPPTIGESHNYGDTEVDTRLNASAVVEPDADGDGFGDETQDLCPVIAATHDLTCTQYRRQQCLLKKRKVARKRCLCKLRPTKASRTKCRNRLRKSLARKD